MTIDPSRLAEIKMRRRAFDRDFSDLLAAYDAQQQESIKITTSVCVDCGAPLVWTAVWQGADCVICKRKEHDAQQQTIAALLHAGVTDDCINCQSEGNASWWLGPNVGPFCETCRNEILARLVGSGQEQP